MTFEEIEQKVAGWADDRKLLNWADGWVGASSQFAKLDEEMRVELGEAIEQRDMAKAIDAIGDSLVVLSNIAFNLGATPSDCYLTAWNQIKDRTGKTVNGVFVKDEQA